MKTLQELYKEVISSDELKQEFLEASKSKEELESFLKNHGCDASFEDLSEFLKERSGGELSDDELEFVAGGSKAGTERAGEIISSIICSLVGSVPRKFRILMKKIMWTTAFAVFIGTIIALVFMPERVPVHYDFAGNINRWGSKYENLIFPVVILFFCLFWTFFTSYFEKKNPQAARNTKVLSIAGVSTTVLFAIMQLFFLLRTAG